jgi:hypothetical protein
MILWYVAIESQKSLVKENNTYIVLHKNLKSLQLEEMKGQ